MKENLKIFKFTSTEKCSDDFLFLFHQPKIGCGFFFESSSISRNASRGVGEVNYEGFQSTKLIYQSKLENK